MTIDVRTHPLRSRDDETAWDRLVESFGGASVFQTAAWARYERALFGARHLALVSEDGGHVSGALLVSLVPRGIDRFAGSAAAPALSRALGALSTDLRWSHGPLAADRASANALVVAAVERAAAAGAGRAGPWRPSPVDGAAAPDARGWPTREECTLLVDLRRPAAELWSAVDPMARKAVRRAQRLGLVVEEAADIQTLGEYQRSFRASRAEQGHGSHGFRAWRIQWEAIGPPGSKDARFLAVRQGSEIAAVMTLWVHAGYAQESALAQSRQSVSDRTRAADLLKWWSIEHLSAQGVHTYDLGGVEEGPAGLGGIARFKEKWGGQRRCVETRRVIPIQQARALSRDR